MSRPLTSLHAMVSDKLADIAETKRANSRQRAAWHKRIAKISAQITDLAALIREVEGEDSELAQAVGEASVLLDEPWQMTKSV